MKVLVTGVAGFIGYHLAQRLLKEGIEVYGIDNLNEYTAQKNLLPMQPGDLPCTYADVDALIKDVGFKPATPIEEGIHCFVQWYREYYKN